MHMCICELKYTHSIQVTKHVDIWMYEAWKVRKMTETYRLTLDAQNCYQPISDAHGR